MLTPFILPAAALISPASVFGEEGRHWVRIVLKQTQGKIPGALDKLRYAGFSWENTAVTDTILQAAEELANAIDPTNL